MNVYVHTCRDAALLACLPACLHLQTPQLATSWKSRQGAKEGNVVPLWSFRLVGNWCVCVDHGSCRALPFSCSVFVACLTHDNCFPFCGHDCWQDDALSSKPVLSFGFLQVFEETVDRRGKKKESQIQEKSCLSASSPACLNRSHLHVVQQLSFSKTHRPFNAGSMEPYLRLSCRLAQAPGGWWLQSSPTWYQC